MNTRTRGVGRTQTSVKALQSLLQAVVASPDSYTSSAALSAALVSQGALAKFSDPERGIFGCSLNTQKTAADEALAGGYAALNTLRLSAHGALDREQSGGDGARKGTKADLATELRDAKAEVQELLEDLFLLQRAFDLRCAQARRYAEASKSAQIIALSKKEQREVEAGLSLRHRQVPTSNVTQLPRKNENAK